MSDKKDFGTGRLGKGGGLMEGSKPRHQQYEVPNTGVNLVYSKDWEKVWVFGACERIRQELQL